MLQATPREVRDKAWLALLLAVVGGCVDAVGYVVLFKIFTAHMSGNSIASTVHAGEGDWGEACRRAFPVPVFVLGVAAGAAVCEVMLRRGARSVFAAALALEAALLFAFTAFGAAAAGGGPVPAEPAWRFYLIAALPALAMGVQNAALRRVGGAGVRTTYITGMLTNFAEEATLWLFPRPRPDKQPHLPPRRPPSAARALLHLGLWLCFVGGGLAGVAGVLRWGPAAVTAPACVLVGVAAYDLARPIRPRPPAGDAPDWEV